MRIIVVALDVSQNSFDIWSKNSNFIVPQQSREIYFSATTTMNIDLFECDHFNHDQYVWLDFALFDAETDTNIKLTHSKIELSPQTPSQNPIIVICNYLFDRFVYFFFLFYSFSFADNCFI